MFFVCLFSRLRYFHCGSGNRGDSNVLAGCTAALGGCNAGGNPTWPNLPHGFNFTRNIVYVKPKSSLLERCVAPPPPFVNSDCVSLCFILFHSVLIASVVACVTLPPFLNIGVTVNVALCCALSISFLYELVVQNVTHAVPKSRIRAARVVRLTHHARFSFD
jgi:hypothetical protein